MPDESGSHLAAIESAGGSITSAGLQRALAGAAPGARESLMRNANPQRARCGATNRGCGAMRFTRTACEADWVAFEAVRVTDAGTPTITRLVCEPSADAGPSP